MGISGLPADLSEFTDDVAFEAIRETGCFRARQDARLGYCRLRGQWKRYSSWNASIDIAWNIVMHQFHYTDNDGHNAIGSQPVWVFKAAKPPGDHPFGAYFTTLPPDAAKLALRLRIPRTKLEFVFCFSDRSDLIPLRGGRGHFIFYSPEDYSVNEDRQVASGTSGDVEEALK